MPSIIPIALAGVISSGSGAAKLAVLVSDSGISGEESYEGAESHHHRREYESGYP